MHFKLVVLYIFILFPLIKLQAINIKFHYGWEKIINLTVAGETPKLIIK